MIPVALICLALVGEPKFNARWIPDARATGMDDVRIDESGRVATFLRGGRPTIAVETPRGRATFLPTLKDTAIAIKGYRKGVVAGYGETTVNGAMLQTATTAFLWRGGRAYYPEGEAAFTKVAGVTDNGQIIGMAISHADPSTMGQLEIPAWLNENGVVELKTSWHPEAANDAGSIVGYTTSQEQSSGISFEFYRAIAWRAGRLTDLPLLHSGVTSQALDVNNHGQIAGTSFDSAKPCVVVWTSLRPRVAAYGPADMNMEGVRIDDSGTVAFGAVSYDDSQKERRKVFLARDGRTFDIDRLVAPGPFRCRILCDMNPRGQLAVIGQAGNRKGVFVLTPIKKRG